MTRASLRARVACILLASACSGADALALHIGFRRSDPATGSRLIAAPRRIVLWFTARPQLPFSRIRLVGPTGDVSLAAVQADTGDMLSAAITGPMPAGVYRVVWQTASPDGHAIRGEFAFVVDPAAQPSRPDATSASGPAPGAAQSDRRSAAVVRWFEFAGLLSVLGVLVFAHAVLPPLATRGVVTGTMARRARGLGAIAAAGYAVAGLARLVSSAAAVRDSSGLGATAWAIVTGSSWGHGWLFGVAGALLALAGFAAARRGWRIGTPTALTGALGMALSPALAGHAASAQRFVAGVTLDTLHVVAAGAWVGGLLVVVTIGIPAMTRVVDGNPDAAVSALINSFHPIALLCAPLAVAAGLGNSALRLGELAALTSTDYGRTLLFKTGLVVLVAALGAYNSTRARRRLGNAAATASLRRSAGAELVLAALVVAATTILVGTPLPNEVPAP